MTASLLLGLLAAAHQPGDTVINVRIEMHPAIIPAVMPYVECLNRNQTRLSQRAGPLDAERMRGVVAQARARCARSRSEARRRALTVIAKERGVPAGERQAVVDSGLAGVDASDDAFLEELARAERAAPVPEQ